MTNGQNGLNGFPEMSEDGTITLPMNWEIAFQSAKQTINRVTMANVDLEARIEVLVNQYKVLLGYAQGLEKEVAVLKGETIPGSIEGIVNDERLN